MEVNIGCFGIVDVVVILDAIVVVIINLPSSLSDFSIYFNIFFLDSLMPSAFSLYALHIYLNVNHEKFMSDFQSKNWQIDVLM